MAILQPQAGMAGYQMAMSRNRATEGRATKNPLDVYMQKGQIVARQMPMSRVDFPSDAQVRNTASVVREREIEKQLDLGDVMALRWRANKSRYNWWEILGKIYISREYNSPGSVVALNNLTFRQSASILRIRVRTDKYCFFELLDFGTPEEYQANHYWRYVTHREAGMNEQHRGAEVLTYKIVPLHNQRSYVAYGYLYIHSSQSRLNHIMMIRAGKRSSSPVIGETGLFYWTLTNPWWLDAPFPFMP